MPELSVITVNDRESTPVAQAFSPIFKDGETAVFEVSGDTPSGNKRLTVTVKRNAERVKVQMVLSDPVVVTETINDVSRNTVERTGYCRVEFTFDADSTLQERKNIVGMIHNALSDSQTDLMSVLQNLEGYY